MGKIFNRLFVWRRNEEKGGKRKSLRKSLHMERRKSDVLNGAADDVEEERRKIIKCLNILGMSNVF
jgi:hypothetical protein